MPVFTYEFEDLDLGEGAPLTGRADVTYKIERDEPDVGYIGGVEYYLTDIEIDLEDGAVRYLNDAPELEKKVESALLKKHDDYIRDEIYKDHDAHA